MGIQQTEFLRNGEPVHLSGQASTDELTLQRNGDEVRFRIVRHSASELSLIGENETLRGHHARNGDELWIHVDGRTYRLTIPQARGRSRGAAVARDEILAPMTGTVLKVLVDTGDEVSAGQPLMVIEAMKMEHVLRSPRDGIVAEVNGETGRQAEAMAILLRLAPESGPAQ